MDNKTELEEAWNNIILELCKSLKLDKFIKWVGSKIKSYRNNKTLKNS